MIAILFATRKEAAPFLERQRGVRQCLTPFEIHRCDGDILVCISGMGPAAAEAATRFVADAGDITAIVNAGICGALNNSERFEPAAVFRIRRTRPWPAPASRVPRELASGPWVNLPSADLVTTTAPVFDDAIRMRLAATADLVDMEGDAVAGQAHAADLPCWIIKGVSDRAADGDRDLLHRNLAAVSTRIAGILARGLSDLSPGVTP